MAARPLRAPGCHTAGSIATSPTTCLVALFSYQDRWRMTRAGVLSGQSVFDVSDRAGGGGSPVAAGTKFGIGQPVHRREDPVLVQGHGRYTDDIALSGQV